jgi:hypothetical protein
MNPPICDYSNCKSLAIYKIKFEPNKTSLEMVYFTNDLTSKKNKGYYTFPNDLMLVDCENNLTYQLISTYNVDLHPKKNYYFISGIIINFYLFFEPVRKMTNYMDLISESKGVLIKGVHMT